MSPVTSYGPHEVVEPLVHVGCTVGLLNLQRPHLCRHCTEFGLQMRLRHRPLRQVLERAHLLGTNLLAVPGVRLADGVVGLLEFPEAGYYDILLEVTPLEGEELDFQWLWLGK